MFFTGGMLAASLAAKAVDQGLDAYKSHQAISHSDFWNRQNIALQKEFAQNSIRWRVEDAKRAGVHPMAALGISPASFSNVSNTFSTPSSTDYISGMGQDIGRAIEAGKDQEGRLKAEQFNDKINSLTLEKAGLENDLLRAQIDSLRTVRHSSLPPAAPSTNPGKVNPLGGTENVPLPPRPGYNFDSTGLFDLSRHGNTLFEYVNPDKADSITESQLKHIGSMGVSELEASSMREQVLNSKLITPLERKKILSGEWQLVRIPGVGYQIIESPAPKPIRGFRGPARGVSPGSFVRY